MEKEKYKYLKYDGGSKDIIFKCEGEDTYYYKDGEWIKNDKQVNELIENDNFTFISEEEAKEYIK